MSTDPRHLAIVRDLVPARRFRLSDGAGSYLTADFDWRTNVNTPFVCTAPGMAYSFDSEAAAAEWLAAAVRVDPTLAAFSPEDY